MMTKKQALAAAGYQPRMGRPPMASEKLTVRADLYLSPSMAARLPEGRWRAEAIRQAIQASLNEKEAPNA
jgi:hypothetical protein